MEYDKFLPWQREVLIRAIELANENKRFLYLVGGGVRDILLNFPLKDLDFVIIGDGKGFVKTLAHRLDGKLIEESEFFTYKLKLPNREIFDIACARQEHYCSPGALPNVKLAKNIGEDLLRRDFTINAMAIGLSQGDEGLLIDPFRGKKDLDCLVLRVLHHQSFIDDPTRMLRGLRYLVRYNLRWSEDTNRLLNSALLPSISKARLFNEFKLIFVEKDITQNLKYLSQLGFLNNIIEGSIFPLDFAPEKVKKAVITWEKDLDVELEQWFIWLLILTKELELHNRIDVAEEYQLTQVQKKAISWNFVELPINDYELHIFLKPYCDEFVVFLYVCGLTTVDLANLLKIRRGKKLPINGQDLINKLSLNSGPIIGEILNFLEKKQWANEVNDVQDALNFAKIWLMERKKRF